MLNRPIRFVAHLTALLLVITLVSPPLRAQHYHSGVQMKLGYQGFGNYDPGRYGPQNIGPGYIGPGNVGYANFGTLGYPFYGGTGFVQPYFPYCNGLVVPSIVTAPAYGFPGIYGYGNGWYGYGSGIYGPDYGWYGYGAVPPGWSIDPYSGIAVSYNTWNAPIIPYMGGVYSYYPESILAPTLLSMSFSMQPSVPSMVSCTFTDPRILDVIAPAPQVVPAPQVAPVPEPPLPADQLIPDAPPLPGPEAGAPLLNEFESLRRSEKVSTLAEKIHSLRYQATGDESFRKEDYVSAEVFYKSAIEMAPDRKAPYIRMAFVQLALANFPKAVSHLKAGVIMPDDGTRSWVSVEELYGPRPAELAGNHAGKLWNWLGDQPLSSDRLLLAGTFQKLRGFDQVAAELLTMASHEGPEAAYVASINEIAASDVGRRAISQDLAQLIETTTSSSPAEVAGEPAGRTRKSANSHDRQSVTEGILLRGRRMAAVAAEQKSQRKESVTFEATPENRSGAESAPVAEVRKLVIPAP